MQPADLQNWQTPLPLHVDNWEFTVVGVESTLFQLKYSHTSRGGHYALNHFFEVRLQTKHK